MKDCHLCSEIQHSDAAEFWNRPLWESENFIVIPSLGALVEGWLLIVPKEHYICIGEMPSSLIDELNSVKFAVAFHLKDIYGEVVAFEHGPSTHKSKVGCSVDHAHLHVVPTSLSLVTASSKFLPDDVNWVKGDFSNCRSAFADGKDYLYLEQPVGDGAIFVSKEIGSQVFRKSIACNMGILDESNWRDYPKLNILKDTVERIQRIRMAV